MTKLGKLLKSEREKRGLSLHEIGMSLKINPKILKAIEDGDQGNLPAKTFLRGFVKSYAQFLRLDQDQTQQMFQEEYGSAARPVAVEDPAKGPNSNPSVEHPTHAPGPRHENTLKRPESSSLPVSSNNRVYTIVIAIVLLTLIAFVAKMMDKYQKESRVSKTDIPAAEGTVDGTPSTTLPVSSEALSTPVDPSSSTSTTLLHGSTTTLAPGTTSESTSTTTTTTTLKPGTGAATTAVSPVSTTTLRSTTASTLAPTPTTTTVRPVTSPTVAPITTTTLRPTPALTPSPTTTTTIRASTITTLAPTTTTLKPTAVTTTTLRPTAAPTTPGVAPTAATATSTVTSSTTTTLKPAMTEVIVEALNRVSIRFTLNGGQSWESLTLNPDQVHTFRSRSNVQLEFTDGGAVNVIVNGRDRGVPGTIGKPIKLTYP